MNALNATLRMEIALCAPSSLKANRIVGEHLSRQRGNQSLPRRISTEFLYPSPICDHLVPFGAVDLEKIILEALGNRSESE